MKRTAIVTATTAALLLPAMAWGSPYGRNSGYGRNLGGNERVIRSLARDVEYAANDLFRDAQRYAHHGDYREARALDQLYELCRAAKHFHHEVRRSHYWDRHLGRDFERLTRAYREAHHSRRDLHAIRHVDRDFYRLHESMRRLDYAISDWYRFSGHRPYRSGLYITFGYGGHDHYYRDRHYRDRRYRDKHYGKPGYYLKYKKKHYKHKKKHYKYDKRRDSRRGRDYDRDDRYDDRDRDRDRRRRGSALRTRPSR